ncbi:hypothetical protein [Polyangium sp. 6x1]|uniref:hypothetical protein n=1 Tax=Polyangium sp. 6x1 TaxID=3042689 RepID=UPI00248305F0|nr:hypothetical protein [Polyangium sp. 6x1]MDI1450779.1 hypothetical protein [Polyangium sp. 6x1]
MSDELIIPNRFESILADPKLNPPTPLILPVEHDLALFDRLHRRARLQGGGVLAFLRGQTGTGKTTAVYSAAAHMSDRFASVKLVPEEVALKDINNWLRANLPPTDGRTHIVLLDGREITDDTVGLSQFLSGLNQFLRRRKDVVGCWPTNDTEWLASLRDLAQKIGGENFTPSDAVMEIHGPDKSMWEAALERLLIQLDLELDDLALDESAVRQIVESESTIGNFLGKIGAMITDRVNDVQAAKHLPLVMFVVSSGSDVASEANRIRRAKSLLLKAPELLAYSPQSRAGKWWAARSGNPEHHLGYIISLFRSRLATMTPSPVSYACLHYGPTQLKQAVVAAGVKEHISNARVTLQATDFYRYLTSTTLNELTSGKKGKTSDATEEAYKGVQALSARRHKDINVAICKLISSTLSTFSVPDDKFEVDGGDGNLFTDAVATNSGEEIYLEFHHLSPENCVASKMASYIMEKLQMYAIHYNLVPR